MLKIIAKEIDAKTFSYECPFCYSRYNKNGEPHKKAKRLIHRHGSCGNLDNRIESRVSHCVDAKEILIEINDLTKKTF